MLTAGTIIQLIISIFCSVVSGLVLWIIQKHRKEDEARRDAEVTAAVKVRELQLANAKATELIARKIDGEGINGELHDAAENLTEKREAVENYTREQYFRHLGGNNGTV